MRLLWAAVAALALARPCAAGSAFDDLSRSADLSMLAAPVPVKRPAAKPRPAARFSPSLGWSLEVSNEKSLLGEGGHPSLRAVCERPCAADLARDPVVLVHGIFGEPADLSSLAVSLRGGPRQVYALAYDSGGKRTSLNALGFAHELDALADAVGPGRTLTIVAHSMGGVVSRGALNLLSGAGRIRKWRAVRVLAVDSPWHGYSGPADDESIQGVAFRAAKLFLPDGLEDMRAASPMFGALYTPLPGHVSVKLVFAREGSEVFDYTEGPLVDLAPKLRDLYVKDVPVHGDLQLERFYAALIWSSEYSAFSARARTLADAGKLDAAAVSALLLEHYPRFPGDHMGVVKRTGPGTLAEALPALLGPPVR